MGEELSSVEFIRDYVSLHFDGPRIDALARLEVARDDEAWREGDTAWRDALCSLISHAVECVTETSEWIRLRFDDGAEIRVGVVPEGDQPEAGMFHSPSGDQILL
ncbi:MAG TPA: hypothetical protein VF101_15260 [Gaiellaceae bacterium]